MTRRLQTLATCAALLAALPCAAFNCTDAFGRFVAVPSALGDTLPADLPDDYRIAVCPATYRTVCGLGDMALERLYVPSAGGWESAPGGYALTAMAEDGWETPTAARHARLYDLAYSCLTNPAPRLDLPCGAKVYPLAYGGALDTSGLLCNWSTDVPSPDVNALGLGAACGGLGFAGESACTPVVADLRALLTAYGFGGPAADPEAARDAALASAMQAYREATSGYGHGFATNNYLARGGIRAGDPLRAVDPFAANWWMARTDAVPVLVPAAALPATTNEVKVTAYELRVTSAAMAAAARSLVLSGGGEATVPSTLSTHSLQARREAGPPTLALDVAYTRSYAVPSVRAKVRRTDAKAGEGAWESVGTARVTSPAAGTLSVSRKRIAGTTTYAVVGAEASGGAILDAKTNTVTRPLAASAPDIGWPHASSGGWIMYASVTAFGRRTRRSSRNGSDGTETAEYGAYRCGATENTVAGALSAACAEYYTPTVEYLTQWKDDQLGTAKIKVELPDLTATAWERYVYRSVFTADDPEWEPPGGGTGNARTCYNYEPAHDFDRWPFDPTADPAGSGWDGDGYGDGDDDPKPAPDPDTGYPYVTEYEAGCGVISWRDGEPFGNGMGYTTREECRVERPSALLLVKFNFLHF